MDDLTSDLRDNSMADTLHRHSELSASDGATQLSNLQTHRKLGASGDVGSASVTGIASLAVNDTIEIWFQQSEGVDKDITVKDCTLNIIQIGGT